ncbi:MAG TPA: hypothetical protein VNL14_16785 [Candidatus Acidoferrales bacterium]|nr:hypothetical protein [Candidatus Acidoferrales bacterium]
MALYWNHNAPILESGRKYVVQGRIRCPKCNSEGMWRIGTFAPKPSIIYCTNCRTFYAVKEITLAELEPEDSPKVKEEMGIKPRDPRDWPSD